MSLVRFSKPGLTLIICVFTAKAWRFNFQDRFLVIFVAILYPFFTDRKNMRWKTKSFGFHVLYKYGRSLNGPFDSFAVFWWESKYFNNFYDYDDDAATICIFFLLIIIFYGRYFSLTDLLFKTYDQYGRPVQKPFDPTNLLILRDINKTCAEEKGI